MLARWQKFISIFFLLAFLFPIATEIAHRFHHQNDSHCTEHNILHYHEMEHHCSVCDFVIVAADTSAFVALVAFDIGVENQILSFLKTYFFEQKRFSFSLRAPPVIY